MLNKFLLHFNFYFIRIFLIGAILILGWMIGDALSTLYSGGELAFIGTLVLVYTAPLFILSLILFYFYRKKRNLIVESIFIILLLLVLFWVLYEIISITSKPHSRIFDLEVFSIYGFGSFLLVIMLISFFKFRKTISS